MKYKLNQFLIFTNKALTFDNVFLTSVIKKKYISLITYLTAVILLLTSIAITINVTKTTSKYNLGQLPDTLINSLRQIPQDYTINIVDGRLYTSYDRPLFIYINHQNLPQSLVVFDEFAGSRSDFDHYESLLLFGQDGIKVSNGTNDLFFKYEKFRNIYIDASVIVSLQTLLRIIKTFMPILLILFIIKLIFINTLIILLGRLFYLAVISGLIYFITHEFNKKINFSDVYKLIIVSSLIPLLIDFTLVIFDMQVRLPFWFLIINSIFGFVAVLEVFFKKKLYPLIKE